MTTIIIPTYNSAHMVSDTINSVLASNLSHYEIIVVNDGSTDQTDNVITPYLSDKRIKYIKQTNRGLAGARNTGINAASGDFLVFLDADDLILPEKLTIQEQYLNEHPDIDVVYSNSEWFIENNFEETKKVIFPVYTGDIKEPLLFGNFIHVNAAMVRKQKVIEVGLFDESLRELEDWDLWLRLAFNNSKFGFTPGVLSKVRIRKGSMTSHQQRMNKTMTFVLQKTINNCIKQQYKPGDSLTIKAYHALSFYKLKAKEFKGYLPFLIKTLCQQGLRFAPIAMKQTIKYLFHPLFNKNETTADIEKIWQNQ